MWGRQELNLHSRRNWNLNPARLPIPPRPQVFFFFAQGPRFFAEIEVLSAVENTPRPFSTHLPLCQPAGYASIRLCPAFWSILSHKGAQRMPLPGTLEFRCFCLESQSTSWLYSPASGEVQSYYCLAAMSLWRRHGSRLEFRHSEGPANSRVCQSATWTQSRSRAGPGDSHAWDLEVPLQRRDRGCAAAGFLGVFL